MNVFRFKPFLLICCSSSSEVAFCAMYPNMIQPLGRWRQNMIQPLGRWRQNMIQPLGRWRQNMIQPLGRWRQNMIQPLGRWRQNVSLKSQDILVATRP